MGAGPEIGRFHPLTQVAHCWQHRYRMMVIHSPQDGIEQVRGSHGRGRCGGGAELSRPLRSSSIAPTRTLTTNQCQWAVLGSRPRAPRAGTPLVALRQPSAAAPAAGLGPVFKNQCYGFLTYLGVRPWPHFLVTGIGVSEVFFVSEVPAGTYNSYKDPNRYF